MMDLIKTEWGGNTSKVTRMFEEREMNKRWEKRGVVRLEERRGRKEVGRKSKVRVKGGTERARPGGGTKTWIEGVFGETEERKGAKPCLRPKKGPAQ